MLNRQHCYCFVTLTNGIKNPEFTKSVSQNGRVYTSVALFGRGIRIAALKRVAGDVLLFVQSKE